METIGTRRVNSEQFFMEPTPHSSIRGPLGHSADQLFKLIVSSVKDYAILMLDREGYILTWNEGAERTSGYSPEEIIGKHFSVFYTSEAIEANHPQHELDVASATGRYEEEGWRVRKDGSMFWSNVVITALYEENELVGFAKVTRDLTEKKMAEQQREENARLLAETNEELQRLAYIVSHELQAPITTITRYCNLLRVRYKDKLGADANDFLHKISFSSQLIGRMVDDLWTYARVSTPGIEAEPVLLNVALTDAIRELGEQVRGVQLEHDELPIIRGNRSQLIYLFKEMIGNAIRYRSEASPVINIGLDRQADGFVFTVKDNGIGIDPLFSSDVFKLFHRVKSEPDPAGTGMGLAICRKIVQQHRGRIWLESQIGLGSTFFVWFPKAVEC